MPTTPIQDLLATYTPQDWQKIWRQNEGICQDYGKYCHSLANFIHASSAPRVFLIQQDRSHFLAGLLAALQAGVDVVIPPSPAPGLIEELRQPGDLVLEDAVHWEESTIQDAMARNLAELTFFTSGSTGVPKPVLKTCDQLNIEIALLDKLWAPTEASTCFYSTVPHLHIYGLGFSLLWPAAAKFAIASQTYPYWEDLIDQAQSKDYLISSPAHLSRLPNLQGQFFSRIFSAAAPLTFEDAQLTKETLGCLPTEILGSTETGAIATRQQDNNRTPWTPLPGVDISLDATTDRLHVKSPYIAEVEGFQTEDKVAMISQTQFHLLGRADRIVKIEGKRVSLADLENRLATNPLIREAIVLPLESSSRDELGAVVTLTQAGQSQLSIQGKPQFMRDLRHSLASYFDQVILPRRWRFVEHLPSDNRGKKPLNLLRELFHEH